MTAICVIGTELSARLQNVLTLLQVGALLIFAIVALIKVYTGNAPEGSTDPAGSWFSPFAVSTFTRARLRAPARRLHLLGLGERRQPHRGDDRLDALPGLAAIVEHARPARHLRRRDDGGRRLSRACSGVEDFDDDEGIFAILGDEVLGSGWD